MLSGFRIDAVAPDGSLVEVQSGSLGPLRGKLSRLLIEHRVRVVKPVVATKRVVKRLRRDGKDLSCRLSPKRGGAIDVFDDLVGVIRLFPHPNLRIDVVEVAIDEVRVPRRRWPGFAVVDRRLRDVGETIALRTPDDLWLLVAAPLPDRFTTVDLAKAIGRPMAFAQRIAYCLRMGDAATVVGKVGNRVVYERRG